MKLETILLLLAAGWIALLVTKYWIVGVCEWNRHLHPNRRENNGVC